ncbi:MAG TPA: hypothetical protein VGT61_11525 [Thermomicrobiales bacterium]|jgi:hypothetical protein|nr:hypothetical protein [Thermomicrobiales bacterium]
MTSGPDTTASDDRKPLGVTEPDRPSTFSRRVVSTALAVAGAALVSGGAKPVPAGARARRAAAQGSVGDVARDADGNMFPTNRIIAWYGTSVNNLMGILGEDEIEATWAGLEEQVAAWQAADPDTIAVPAWEYIATVAQPEPQSDGTFLFDIAFDVIQPYIDYAAERGGLTFVDCQVGRRGVQGEVERLRPLLVQPSVHLAIDPEYAMQEGETPGVQFGSIDAEDVNWALRYLADLAVEEGVPQKTLMVHQFRYDMIENKENIEDVPGVELVLHADGHGAPELKRETYDVVISQWVEQLAFWAGFKVFYNKPDPTRNQYTDQPNMTPEEILQLDPVPYFISYQ